MPKARSNFRQRLQGRTSSRSNRNFVHTGSCETLYSRRPSRRSSCWPRRSFCSLNDPRKFHQNFLSTTFETKLLRLPDDKKLTKLWAFFPLIISSNWPTIIFQLNLMMTRAVVNSNGNFMQCEALICVNDRF